MSDEIGPEPKSIWADALAAREERWQKVPACPTHYPVACKCDYWGHALCDCGWTTTGATPYGTEVAAQRHHRDTGHPIPQVFKAGHGPLRRT